MGKSRTGQVKKGQRMGVGGDEPLLSEDLSTESNKSNRRGGEPIRSGGARGLAAHSASAQLQRCRDLDVAPLVSVIPCLRDGPAPAPAPTRPSLCVNALHIVVIEDATRGWSRGIARGTQSAGRVRWPPWPPRRTASSGRLTSKMTSAYGSHEAVSTSIAAVLGLQDLEAHTTVVCVASSSNNAGAAPPLA